MSNEGPRPAEPAASADCIVLLPNRSLSPRGMAALFAALAGSAVALAVLFLNSGAWPVVPFLVAEVAAVGVTLGLLYRHAGDCEVVRLEDDRLEVVQRQGRRETCHRFPRYWARVAVEPGSNAHLPSRLVIRSHGREVEVGAGMTEEARRALAGMLRRALAPADVAKAGRSVPVTLTN
ncbi:membrane protein [Sulfurifustis variabilis]|uniref:Membrane protein n=1 Tax=Sulfurifustis variabilis TaxID=1675686 RepID=A0A1B4V5K0_9GAMM|nr:DUF2244 domain-containing protein [Sulfurifustis variabilis]BAU48816.1 membrane protein [Sulfurifustis variabilis]